MQPFDARFAVKTARDAQGWASLDAAAARRVDAVLSGETNQLSADAQTSLRSAVMGGFRRAPAAEQARVLGELGNSAMSRPGTVTEPVENALAAVTRTGPAEVPGYAFASGPADALRYELTFADGQRVPVHLPKTTTPEMHGIDGVQEAIARLPARNRALLTSVRINPGANPQDAYWAREYNRPGFRSYMTAGAAGVVDIYPSDGPAASQRVLSGKVQHEMGHVWSERTWGTDRTAGRWVDWRAAMQTDGMAVSGYATADIQEDVAETVQVYGSTRGTPRHDEYRRMVPARFMILDRDLG